MAQALSPHWPSAWETRMGWGLKAAVGLRPGPLGRLGQVGAGETGVQDGRRES